MASLIPRRAHSTRSNNASAIPRAHRRASGEQTVLSKWTRRLSAGSLSGGGSASSTSATGGAGTQSNSSGATKTREQREYLSRLCAEQDEFLREIAHLKQCCDNGVGEGTVKGERLPKRKHFN